MRVKCKSATPSGDSTAVSSGDNSIRKPYTRDLGRKLGRDAEAASGSYPQRYILPRAVGSPQWFNSGRPCQVGLQCLRYNYLYCTAINVDLGCVILQTIASSDRVLGRHSLRRKVGTLRALLELPDFIHQSACICRRNLRMEFYFSWVAS